MVPTAKNPYLRRLKLALGKIDVGHISKTTGLNYQTLWGIFEGNRAGPGPEIIEKICAAFGINAHWVLTGQGEMHGVGGPTLRMIPILDLEAAHGGNSAVEKVGFPGPVMGIPLGFLPEGGDLRLAPFSGRSMEPVIPDGSFVVVDFEQNDADAISGSIAVVSLPESQGVVIKRLVVDGERIILASVNRAYGDRVFDVGVIHPNMIIGRAVAVRLPDGSVRKLE